VKKQKTPNFNLLKDLTALLIQTLQQEKKGSIFPPARGFGFDLQYKARAV
jgi:hypothetical protein